MPPVFLCSQQETGSSPFSSPFPLLLRAVHPQEARGKWVFLHNAPKRYNPAKVGPRTASAADLEVTPAHAVAPLLLDGGQV